MNFKETLKKVKDSLLGMIKEDSSAEHIQGINNLVKDLDELGTAHNEVEIKNATLTETIKSIVSTQGNGDKPEDGASGSKPKTIEECVAEVQEKGGK